MKTSCCYLFLLVVLTGCQQMPETYAPPEQRKPIETYHTVRRGGLLRLGDGETVPHIVRDIADAGGDGWRWTAQRPAFKVVPRSTDKLLFWVDFAVPEVTFKETGPVTISFFVNDHLVDRKRYTAFGPQHIEKPIPPAWVTAQKENIISAEIDKVWTSPADGVKLGFILNVIGLVEQ